MRNTKWKNYTVTVTITLDHNIISLPFLFSSEKQNKRKRWSAARKKLNYTQAGDEDVNFDPIIDVFQRSCKDF